MPHIGMPELIIIFVIVLLIFGGKKIPEVARGLGAGIRAFRKAKEGVEEEIGKEKELDKADQPGNTTAADAQTDAKAKSIAR